MNVLKQMIFMMVVFSYATSLAMKGNQRIAKLKGERAQLLNKIEKKTGDNSTMASRWLSKDNQLMLNKYNKEIQKLELSQAKL